MKCALGLLTVDLHFETSHSLKERRSILNSLKTRVRQRFNVSMVEEDNGDAWQRGGLLIACVAGQAGAVEHILRDVLVLIEQEERAVILGSHVRFYE